MHRPERRPAIVLIALLVVLGGQLSRPSTADAADATDQFRTSGVMGLGEATIDDTPSA